MAGLQQKGDGWYCTFRHNGERHTFAIGKVPEAEALARVGQVDLILMRLKQRLLEIPPNTNVCDFIRFGGKPASVISVAGKTTLKMLRDRYTEANKLAMEANSLGTVKIHFRHFEKILGEEFQLSALTLADLQDYVDKRAKANGSKGRKVSPVTIKKELVTFRTAWKWGAKSSLTVGTFPSDGLRFPKGVEKPPFMTRAQIERKITKGMAKGEIGDLWDSLYLMVDEIDQLLKFVKTKDVQPFVYPMFCFAAHTGARRSEIIRTRVTDVDFEENAITITEKKRVRGKTTTRRVPMSPFLRNVLEEWLTHHRGGPWLFCQTEVVQRSRTRKGGDYRQLTVDEFHDHFLRAIGAVRRKQNDAKSKRDGIKGARVKVIGAVRREQDGAKGKWDVIKGAHVLRHSFISALASKGIDQRMIEEFAGHMSPETSRRYRHLYPSATNEAIASVFG